MADSFEYKCPSCGGAIAFDSKLQKMKCPYCDAEFEMDSLKHMDEHLEELPASKDLSWEKTSGSDWQEGEEDQLKVYICQSCAGEIIADETTAATACPYCDNPVVLKERLAGDLKPDFVLPFKLDKKAAKEALNKHLLGKRLLPKVFKDQNHIDEVKGVYVPFWVFDTDVNADARYKATIVRHWTDRDYEYTETSYYSILRAGKLSFEHVPADASSKLDDQLMESIEPFDFSEAVDFQTAYLAGYMADRYDMSSDDSLKHANQRAQKSTIDTLTSTVQGYATVVPESTSVRFENSRATYVLYPVWLLNTTWNNKKYIFAMNGQTGKFVGDLPLDKQAYWRYFAIIAVLVSVITYGLAWLVNAL
ncbi:DNA-directed RNA polymerase, subunit RPC12/RpoP, contains C4-type Zn-finger [Streptococcus henryi]|jgi:DNA-directed RNA polymerase subunit RPC12/RpoP|uniref:DNA-directed RNA polymerase, subunit RPC12/RpoP, contains C4-type Zn-finger n=1 Tax=Streptococcus henryi TaxID=439219 RepID=A0A1G6CXT8_9STRE|nr:hypothetical protein [Streptococcus henryi]SDB37641.1 DNA-directed RNA polymerase, subunit RPC12/RpoP, contains C4-type Zn-finger [Streptococcus henryi]